MNYRDKNNPYWQMADAWKETNRALDDPFCFMDSDSQDPEEADDGIAAFVGVIVTIIVIAILVYMVIS